MQNPKRWNTFQIWVLVATSKKNWFDKNQNCVSLKWGLMFQPFNAKYSQNRMQSFNCFLCKRRISPELYNIHIPLEHWLTKTVHFLETVSHVDVIDIFSCWGFHSHLFESTFHVDALVPWGGRVCQTVTCIPSSGNVHFLSAQVPKGFGHNHNPIIC